MPAITAWAATLSAQRPDGLMLDTTQVTALAVKAVNAYAAYGALAAHLAIPIADPAPEPPAQYPDITSSTDVTVSEWGVIRPLFMLYVEYETALLMEASRGMGIDPYGRQSSEIMADITTMEANMPSLAWQRDVITI